MHSSKRRLEGRNIENVEVGVKIVVPHRKIAKTQVDARGRVRLKMLHSTTLTITTAIGLPRPKANPIFPDIAATTARFVKNSRTCAGDDGGEGVSRICPGWSESDEVLNSVIVKIAAPSHQTQEVEEKDQQTREHWETQ
jgi:hypothetical protein